jgi:prepilin-type N-terminal cleavage/methylation domain-containing protein
MMRFNRKPNQKGFTMIELMVVVVIVGILAAIAIPIYGNYIRNARLTEATSRIGEVVTAAKAWAQEHQNPAGDPVWPAMADVPGSILDMTATENFTYLITSASGDATANAFVVEATGQNRMTGVTVTVTIPNIHSAGNPPEVVIVP